MVRNLDPTHEFPASLGQRAMFKNLLDKIPGFIWIKSIEGNYIFGNKMFEENFGAPASGHRMEDFHQDLAALAREHDDEVLRELKVKQFTESVQLSDGKDHYFRTTRFPILDATGKPVAIGGFAFDVTLEIELERQNFEDRVRSMNAAKMAALGTLAAEICHELKIPLTVIKSFSLVSRELLKEERPNRDQIVAQLEAIDRAVDRTVKIINSLQNMSRNSEDEAMGEWKIADIMEDVSTLLQFKFKAHQAKYKLIAEEDLLGRVLRCKRIRFSEALINVISNSYDSIPDRKGEWVEVRIVEGNSLYCFEVCDSGPGVQEENREKIFDPFFTTKDIGKGTGLGLSITKSIMEGQGGNIHFDADRKPTCFVLSLPK